MKDSEVAAELDNPKKEAPRTRDAKDEPNGLKRAFKILGPGLITGASDDDPSGIATYSTVGAGFGNSSLWMALFTFPLMLSVQFICAKVGLVTGRGLSGVLKKHYHPAIVWTSITILLVANVINAGTDIGAMAEGVHLIVPQIPAKLAILPIALILLSTVIVFSYKRIASVFKWLTLSLFAYVITAFFCHIDFNVVIKDTFIPNISWQPGYIAALVAILGTTISPYLFFWQTNTEVDEQKDAGQRKVSDRKGASKDDLKYAAYDVGAGMLFSNVVMYFVILTAAATLFKGGVHQIDSAAQAAKALEPMLGSAASYLFAAGFIGTGFLAVPVLIGSAAYAIAETMGRPCGYGEKFGDAKFFYGLVIIGTLVGTAFNFTGINAMQALYFTAILNGVLAPPLLLLLMLVSNNKEIMGPRTNTTLVNIGGWLTFAFMTIAVILFAWSSLQGK
jgi:NRAMP (natural resistance-associated macrophage protein)-like metal ion transporter